MTAFATAQDLATFLEHDVDTARANLLLDEASAAIRAYTRTTFDLATSTIRIRVQADSIRLPQRPVVSVQTVKRVNPDNTMTTLEGWIFDGIDTIFGSNRLTWVINLPAVWTDYPYPTTVEVGYTHGYASVPAEVVAICIQYAGRYYETPAAGAITAERIGSYSYKVAEVRGESRLLALQTDEMAILNQYRRSASRTVVLR